MIGPIKAARITEVVLGVLGVAGAIIFAVYLRSLFSIIFAAAVAVLLPLSVFRSWKISEKEMIRRQDQALGKPSGDPRDMARWVP
jgi:hypothetical protein